MSALNTNDDILEIALGYIGAGHAVAVATVVETWGSSPRPVGAQLAICADGTFMGSVSGGCVEGAVVAEAQEALADGQCRVLEYGVTDEQVFAVGLACGGTIRILVEPIGIGQGPGIAVLEYLVAKRAAKRPFGYKVNLQTWDRAVIEPADFPDRFASDKSGLDGDDFTLIYNPPLRLVIVGAVHIAQHLAGFARAAGYNVSLIDPRDSFGSAARFAQDKVISDWPDAALKALKPDVRTAVVTLSHDPKLDTPALQVALNSDAFYIGSLGSRRTHGKRLDQLTEMGFTAGQLARIHGPVGADIGAATPAEIALSIMAQLTERLRRPDSRP